MIETKPPVECDKNRGPGPQNQEASVMRSRADDQSAEAKMLGRWMRGTGCVSFVRFDLDNDYSLVPLKGQPPQNLMAPVSMVLADRDLKAVVDDFNTKLPGLRSSDQDQLLRHWFKRQDELIVSDAERLKRTQSDVKLLVRDFQLHAIPLGKRLKQRELALEDRLLNVEKMLKTFEAKYIQTPSMNNEAESTDKLAAMSKGISLEDEPDLDETLAAIRKEMTAVKERVGVLVHDSHVPSNIDRYLPSDVKIDEQSLADLQEALRQQREAIAKAGVVLNRVTKRKRFGGVLNRVTRGNRKQGTRRR